MSDQNTTITETALSRMLSQFEGSVNLRKLVSSYLDQAQALEDAAWPLLGERGFANATGDRLDGIGAIFNIPRAGRSDTFYRLALQAELAVLRSNGTEADLTTIAEILISATVYEVVEKFPKWVSLRAPDYSVVDSTGIAAGNTLRRAVSAGTTFFFIASIRADANIYTLSSSTNLETSALLGLANEAQSTGGYMAWAY